MNTIEEFFKKLTEQGASITVFELGACDGYHTRKLIGEANGKISKWVAFEAAPYNWPKLESLPPVTHLIRGAVAAKDGMCQLWLSSGPGYYGSSSLLEPKLHTEVWPDCKFEQRVEVPCFKLDTVANLFGIRAVDFVWCDIQGGERDAITGGASILKNTRYFYSEVSDAELYSGQMLRKDFADHLSSVTGVKWSVERDFGGDVLFRNESIKR